MRDDIRDMRNMEFVSQTGRTLLTLRELLLKGEFHPGERLSELALVARLGVSRTPIRLALDRLAHEGLLGPSPSGGFVVREFTLEDIWDAIEMRGVLEGTAARLAAERLRDVSELSHIKEIQSQMDVIANNTFESFAQYMSLNGEFHAELVRLAKSPMLERSISHLTKLPFAAPSAGVYARHKGGGRHTDIATIGWQQHHAIVEALEKRQGTRAEAIAREHSNLARQHLELVLSEGNFSTFLPGASLVRVGAVN
jgi:GntR family transcriptional regulator of vanillate catabolism